ncbi:hypothetical protein JOQ06_000803 [Pogonophryne albipinna]|uniref:Leucine-rich repeat-containing protein 42 n=1 Tax=Pogonophryne albipinna TaxID=1090488 RepID=A0AAD6B4T4_9TELE|nr:hypothetical protein JOQ06_000803 [Pogonophryne albipinna]
MENSAIYVRERGNLRRVSDIVLAQPKPVSSCRRTNPFVLRKENFIFTYNAEGSLRYTTKSLFDITLLFVADNIHHVDSLVGFPDQIGDRLFAAAEENRVFLNADISSKALQLFSDAYGEMVLGSLCLRNSSLMQLSIGGNRLSDVGLQRFTAPIRMLRKGLDCLQLLDVSYNPISVRALRYITCFPKLENLDVSGTSVKLGTGLKTTIWDLLGLIYSEKSLDRFDHSRCKTEGWAEQVVNQWETNNSQMPKLKRMDESRTSALHFFGRQKFVRDVLNAAPLVCESEEETQRERLHFFRPAANSHIPEKQTPSTTNQQGKPSWYNIKKRQRQSERCDSSRQSPPTKRLPSSALTAEDLDLLNNY